MMAIESVTQARPDGTSQSHATGRFVRRFDEIGIGDVALVGGKNASLGEMFHRLTRRGVRVPDGFAITAEAYRHVLDRAGAWPALRAALAGLDAGNVEDPALPDRREPP